MIENNTLPENIEKGVIPEEIVNQMREGHYWGVPLVFMADKIGFKPEVGKSIKMTVLPNKRFSIPSAGAIHYEVRTDPENENKKTFVCLDKEIGDVVEFEQIENHTPFPPSTKGEDAVSKEESILLEKKTLPHKETWNRVEEGIAAKVLQTGDFDILMRRLLGLPSKDYKKVKYPAGSLPVDPKKHEEFLEQFKHKMFGLIEIVSQNSAAATFGENEMAGMFNTMTFTPFVNEEDMDFKVIDVKFLVKPIDRKERNWNVVIVAENAKGPIFSLEMECAVSTKKGLDKMLEVTKKLLEEKKEKAKVQETQKKTRKGLLDVINFGKEQPLEKMPSKEEMDKGLEELIELGIARKLNEANPEQGVYFDIVEINCQGKGDLRNNNFIRGLAIAREKTFRKTGEGTGNSLDWDSIDEYVRQTITWDPEEKMIVSGSRMAVPDETLGKPTFFKNLYDTEEDFERSILEKSAELGRTFLNGDYLQHLRKEKNTTKMRPAAGSIFTGVLKQFDTLVEEGHKLKYMNGAVSIDERYSEQSLCRYAALYTHFFPANKMFDPSLVKPKEGISGVKATISEFTDEKWVDLANFSKSEKQLKSFLSEEATKNRAQHPKLMGQYPAFVGSQEGACAYFNPVINDERSGCMEIGLVLDISKVPLDVEQKYSPKGKDLTKEESVAGKVAHF